MIKNKQLKFQIFIARLVALVPKPRFHLTRFHGVFAPNSKHRAEVTGEANEKQNKSTTESSRDVEESRGKMSWAMRLKRVFNIDISVCRQCQGRVRIIGCIEDGQVIKKILAHIKQQGEQTATAVMGGLGIRAPPIDSRPLMNQ